MLRNVALAITLTLALPGAAFAQEADVAVPADSQLAARADQVLALLNAKAAPEDLFTQNFLAAVPAAQVKVIAASITAQFGAAVEVIELTPNGNNRAVIAIRLERGMVKGFIGIAPGEDNRISELLFNQVDSVAVEGDTAEKIAADLAALPGTVGAWFSPIGEAAPVISIAPAKPLALGSTFKLYVLAALAQDVRLGKRRWDDVVPLTVKSYPSGRLQDWPQGAPMTLHTLASLMISISDNTATDQLIAVLGRDRILQLMRDSGHAGADANDPFLTTREFFLLKASDPDRIMAWRIGDAAARRAILAEVAKEDAGLDQINAAFAAGPRALEVEYFASPADLARLYAHMRLNADPEAFRIMAINPSATPAILANWDYVGFKGGSEPGVINLTWFLRDKTGRDHVLTLGWNNPAASVDEGKLEGIAQRILLLPR